MYMLLCKFVSIRSQIRGICRSVTRLVLQSLIAALTLSRLDYDCSTMAGLPARQLNRLQSVLNAAARLVYSARRTEHVSLILGKLHWFRVPQRIEFRLAVLATVALMVQRRSISLMGYSELSTSACALG